MEIKELLEIMLNNVNEGREATHGLIGYNGVVSIDQPEQVYRKPHTYITVDQYNEIRDAHDINTVLNRLNLAIEKLMVVPAQPVTLPAVIPEGYVWDRVKGGGVDFYGKFISKGWTDAQLIDKGYLLPVQIAAEVKPFVIPEGYLWNEAKGFDREFYAEYRADGVTDEQLIKDGYLLQKPTPEFFKPFIAWVCGGCNHVWPRSDYIFTESQFSNIKDSWFSQRLVGALNGRLEDCKPFDSVVSNLSIGETFETVKTMEDLVNKRLNEIYQKL